MTIGKFFNALLVVINAMSPYLLLGFLIAGILHVFVPTQSSIPSRACTATIAKPPVSNQSEK